MLVCPECAHEWSADLTEADLNAFLDANNVPYNYTAESVLEDVRDGRIAPADLVAARGNGDRRLYVVPSLDLVVVRLGAPTLDAEGVQDLNVFDREFWRLLSVAAPTGHDQAAGD